jgi:hypothetical protein
LRPTAQPRRDRSVWLLSIDSRVPASIHGSEGSSGVQGTSLAASRWEAAGPPKNGLLLPRMTPHLLRNIHAAQMIFTFRVDGEIGPESGSTAGIGHRW